MAEWQITVREVERVLTHGEVIERYPDDTPYPSRLVLGRSGVDPIHVVVADVPDEEIVMKCILCKHGALATDRATATFDRHGVVVVIQNVPADVCAQCGEPYFDGPTTDHLLALVDQAVRAGAKLEVREYAAA